MNNSVHRPHVVPASYLGQFSDDPTKGRNALVWVTDGMESKQLAVKNIAVRREFYAPQGPLADQIERELHEFESGLLEKIYQARIWPRFSASEVNQLLMEITHLHYRNPAYANNSGHPRYQAMEEWSKWFIHDLLSDIPRSKVPNHASDQAFRSISKRISDRWTVCVLASAGRDLITSDNPTAIMTNSVDEPIMMWLAIDPRRGFFAYRKNQVTLTTTHLANGAAEVLNGIVAAFSNTHVISHSELTPDQVAAVARWRSINPKLAQIGRSEFTPNFASVTALPFALIAK